MSDFKAKMHQIQFRLGSAPHPAGGAYSAPARPLLYQMYSRGAASLKRPLAEKIHTL